MDRYLSSLCIIFSLVSFDTKFGGVKCILLWTRFINLTSCVTSVHESI